MITTHYRQAKFDTFVWRFLYHLDSTANQKWQYDVV